MNSARLFLYGEAVTSVATLAFLPLLDCLTFFGGIGEMSSGFIVTLAFTSDGKEIRKESNWGYIAPT
jgi:hypothetical protein